MASGSFYVSTSNSNISGRVSWSSSENVSRNRSSVTVSMRLSRTNTGYTTWGTGDFYLNVNGSQVSNRNKSFKIAHDSNTLMVKGTVTVPHNSDGSKSITIEWSGNTDVFNIYSGSGTARLDTIPRKSSMTTSASWTAGSNRTVSITRHSSSFHHEAEVYVKERNGNYNWVNRIEFSTSETSESTGFSTSSMKEQFRHLDGRSSAGTRIYLQTFSGGTHIGTKTYYGTISAPKASRASITNPIGFSQASGQGDQTVYINQSIGINIRRYDNSFTHTLKFRDNNGGSIVHTATDVGSSYTWNPSSSEESHLYNKIPNGVEKDGDIEVFTYFHGVLVRSVTNKDINFRAKESINRPSFSENQISYADINSTTKAITGNDQYIIQSKSDVRAFLDSVATPRNGASIDKYIFSVAGESLSRDEDGGPGYKTFYGGVDTSSDTTLSVRVVDSRGFSTTVTKEVEVIPYGPPSLSFQAKRVNGFEDSTILSISGKVSPITVSGTNKNSLKSANRKHKLASSASYGTTSNLATSGFPNFNVSDITLNLSNQSEWNVAVSISDELETVTVERTVSVGIPIFFIDSNKKSIGINRYPNGQNFLEIDGKIIVNKGDSSNSNLVLEDGGGEPASIVLENSEKTTRPYLALTRRDTEEFSLEAHNDKDAPQSGKQKILHSTGDSLYHMNNEVFDKTDFGELLWDGAYYMNGSQAVYPSRYLYNCPGGWILVWSDYNVSVGSNNFDWVFHVIPRDFSGFDSGGGTLFVVPRFIGSNGDNPGIVGKKLYIDYNKIAGSSGNTGSADVKDVALRKVYSF